MKSLNVLKYLIPLSAAAILTAQPPPKPPAQQPPKPPVTQPGTPAPVKEPGVEAKSPGTSGPMVIVSPDTVVLTVGGEKLTRAQFEELLAALPDQVRTAASGPGPGRRQLGNQLAEIMSLAQEARKRKLDQTSAVKQMIMIQSDQILAGSLAKQVSDEAKPSEAALRTYYDGHKSQYETAKASHILIRFKGSPAPVKPNGKDLSDEEALAKAQDIRKKLLAGGDFAATAKAESDDAVSAAQGGSLGTFPRGQMVPPFDQAAFSLPLNQISEPVKSQFGYHIIRVEERINKSFEEARPDIEKQMKPQMAREAMDGIKKQIPVTLDDSYFGK
jgi:peptidyl-prolyl cis-trans isomerase C